MKLAQRLAAGSGDLVSYQRTEEGLHYERLQKELARIIRSRAPEDVAMVKEANDEIMSFKVNPGEVHVSDVMTNLSVQYANDAFIGLRLMPVISTDGKLSKTFFKYPKRERFAYPDDDMTARTTANELTQTRVTDTTALTPRALREFVDEITLANQDAPLNELLDAQANVVEGMNLLHEKRVAGVMQDPANYDGNTAALGAAARWDVGTGDPVGDILAARAAMFNGAGPARLIAWCSRDVWDVLKSNANILDLFKFSGSNPGLATPDMLAQWFEFDELLIGDAREDTANIGQAAAYSRIWGSDNFGIARVAVTASVRNASFGYSFMDRSGFESDLHFDEKPGTDGGWWTRAKGATSEKVVAGDTSYLYTTVTG